jgi:hypothetical protein
VSPVKYELGFYIPEDDILHSHRVETSNLTKKYISDDVGAPRVLNPCNRGRGSRGLHERIYPSGCYVGGSVS